MNSGSYSMCDEEGKKNSKGESKYDSAIRAQMKPKLQKPRLYRVFLLNDDYTPMGFVVFILEKIFKKIFEEATCIMLNVHYNGVGECGLYTHEMAEMKIMQVIECARKNEHPLQCIME
ncbi:ATP-dependent Clp protease adapter ClpS [Bartonella ancashensis]|nr:ATP-dependent Clp protease adapter ClpS [Bartonella ancashensis]